MQESLFPPTPEILDRVKGESKARKTTKKKPAAKADNPFLSSDVRDQLAKSQAKAHKELNELIDKTRVDRRKPENWVKAQQMVRAKSASILQDVIEQALPSIEAELRKRLQLEMDIMLEELEVQDD